MLSITLYMPFCRVSQVMYCCAEYHYTECRYAKCRYAECRGAVEACKNFLLLFSVKTFDYFKKKLKHFLGGAHLTKNFNSEYILKGRSLGKTVKHFNFVNYSKCSKLVC